MVIKQTNKPKIWKYTENNIQICMVFVDLNRLLTQAVNYTLRKYLREIYSLLVQKPNQVEISNKLYKEVRKRASTVNHFII
jgi:hypothetical protein